jgi:beta-D-xylosidase 4
LTLSEKIDQVGHNGAGGVPRLGIPPYEWWGEALHGVCESPAVNFSSPTPTGTSFPEIIGMGATMDRQLWAAMGTAVGREARAMLNVGHAGGEFWAPNVRHELRCVESARR